PRARPRGRRKSSKSPGQHGAPPSQGSHPRMPAASLLRMIRPAAVRGRLGGAGGLLLPFLFAGCTPGHHPLPILAEVTDAAVTARVLVPPGLNVNPAETVVKPGEPRQPPPAPSPDRSPEHEPTTFTLTAAIAFALRNSP